MIGRGGLRRSLSSGRAWRGPVGLTHPTSSSQISRLVQRPYLDLARSRHRIGAALHPRDRLAHALDFPEPEARDQLACRGERSVDDRAAGTIERNTLAVRGGLEA